MTGRPIIDLTNKKFGRLTVIRRGANRNSCPRWWCLCECGAGVLVGGASIRHGKIKSCGCYRKTMRVTHGHTCCIGGKKTARHKTWHVWNNMLERCKNPNNKAWGNYGGRGITVCLRWEIFENFLEDMGESLPKMHLDRINNDGNYEPGNCRWITHKENCRNKTDSTYLTIKGVRAHTRLWSELSGTHPDTIRYRRKQGWPHEDVVFGRNFN